MLQHDIRTYVCIYNTCIHPSVVTASLFSSYLSKNNQCFIALDPKPKSRLSFKGIDLLTPNKQEALELSEIICKDHDKYPYKEIVKNNLISTF